MSQPSPDELERQLRSDFALGPRDPGALRNLAMFLIAAKRPEEALALTAPRAASTADAFVLDAHAGALAACGQPEQTLIIRRRMAKQTPGSISAHHNLGAILGDLGRHAEAEQSLRRALQLGGRSPETWHVLGHALQGQGKLEEAEEAYRVAVGGRPDYYEAQADLAQLIWMRTEDFAAASQTLDQAITAYPNAGSLVLTRARLREFAGDPQGSFEESARAAAASPGDASIQHATARQALAAGEPAKALAYSQAAARIDNDEGDSAGITTVAALLALGRIEEAAGLAETLHSRWPKDQMRIALMATAWRLLGDPRYAELYDYAAFVRGWTIDTPKGWRNLTSYLADLKGGLDAMHSAKTHPVGQSLRHGTQTNENLLAATHPAIAAFSKAIEGPIQAHMAAVGKGEGPLRSRNTRTYDIAGIWSVRLRPNGFHVDHVHPAGWLSSACYIDLPHTVDAGGREGWIKFGEPGVATLPRLEPEHFVKPEPGLLVLFPSYVWHGTVPFSGEQTRLTVAFDLLPKETGLGQR